MDIFLYAAGVVAAALILIAALFGTVAAYLLYCAKHPSKKFRAEVSVVVIVAAASLIIRMLIGYYSLTVSGVEGGVTSFFHGLFSAVAGLTFNSLLELGELGVQSGVLSCLYYGIIAYASLVFLIVVTVGLSYEFYSRVQMLSLRRRFSRYYIITAITQDSLLLAESIKKHEEERSGGRRKGYAIIFFESGEESFSRKNALHRRISEQGFFYYSDCRRTDCGELISFLRTFKFRKKDCEKDDRGEDRHKLFYVFAVDDCGGFEGDNAEVVFDDLQSVLSEYVRAKHGKILNAIPTVVNYYLLTGGEINYESYERRLGGVLDGYIEKICASSQERASLRSELYDKLQVKVFNEATLSSQNMLENRKRVLNGVGAGAYFAESVPDENGAYRICVLGFGKTGQYAMEELYTHTAHIVRDKNGYRPTQFIADVYDVNCDDKTGLFAYNHPLFRCINEKGASPLATGEVIKEAGNVDGEAYNALYADYSKITGAKEAEAKAFVDEKMAFPIAVFHSQSCFKYPFMDSKSADAAVRDAHKNHIRGFVVSLGNDELNIAMANVLIDSFKRAYLGDGAKGDDRVTVFVNLIEERSAGRLNWSAADEARFAQSSGGGKKSVGGENGVSLPRLSVVPFGCRNQMFSYKTLINDYGERLFNLSYSIYKAGKQTEEAQELLQNLNAPNGYYRYSTDERASDAWLKLTPFVRRSNTSSQIFSVNYFDYNRARGGVLTDEDYELLQRTEHERWNRFNIAHGWTYYKYGQEERALRRAFRQHPCLCPYDVMLDSSTTKYDRANVEIGLIGCIVYGSEWKIQHNDGEN